MCTSLFQASDANVMKKRAERFGTSASGPSTTVVSIPVSDVCTITFCLQRCEDAVHCNLCRYHIQLVNVYSLTCLNRDMTMMF